MIFILAQDYLSPNGTNACLLTLHAAIYVPYNYRKVGLISQLKIDILDSKIRYMDSKTILIIIASLAIIATIIIIIMVKNARNSKFKSQVDELYVRFNTIKTVPIAFKLNKAQTMAKRNEQTAASIEDYYNRYEETEKNINNVQELLNIVDDDLQAKNYKRLVESMDQADKELKACEEQIQNIDSFLEDFSMRDDQQREYSTSLKEKYLIVKNTINDNSNLLSISYNGILEKLQQCEELFSTSEESMYASDYDAAQVDLEKIDDILDKIKLNANAIPKCLKDVKGVLPVMLDEVRREYALTKQRGIYVGHLSIDEKIDSIEKTISEDTKKLLSGETEGIRSNCSKSKKALNEMLDTLAAENRSFKEAKETSNKAYEHINDLEKVENYVRIAYDKDSQRFGLDNLSVVLRQQRDGIEKYKENYRNICEDLAACLKPASEILLDAEALCANIEADKKSLYSYKTVIDKSTDGETRAASQLTKLQLVVSEVETKIAEYHLPIISGSYTADLEKSREYINNLRKLINEVPINIEVLNAVLDEAIDFVYKFYNNVNNIVGMANMVENAIVFGNKFRSTYPEIDRELSKAEFQYLNGEYTKALKTAISCMETLFPDNADRKIMESMK